MVVYTCFWGELLMDFAFKIRSMMFREWVNSDKTVSEICKAYGLSRKSFYKFKRRFDKEGFEALHDKIRRSPSMPHTLSLEKRLSIMDSVYDKPVRGAKYISMSLALKGVHVSEGAVWNFLSSEELNTRRKRRLWAASQGKDVFTRKEKQYMQSKHRHIESGRPGELVGLDTITISVKGLGKLWQYTACDTYSSYGWAKLYVQKTADNAVDFFCNHVLRNCPEGKIRRVLTDQGIEFYSARHKGSDSYFTTAVKWCGVGHTVTKKAHPWTNGYTERLNQTIWQEFYLSRLSRPFNSISELQDELDKFMVEYNFKRMHTGYKLKAGGFRFPGHAFFDIHERNRMIEVKY